MIVKLSGGLGNQMFQYAFARAFELKTGKMVRYDLNWLNDKSLQGDSANRDFELNVFNVSINTLKSDSFLNYVLRRKSISQKILFRSLVKLYYLKDLKEKTPYSVDSTLIKSIGSRSHVQGHFQTEMYFKDYRESIINDFQLKNQLSDNSLKYASEIAGTNSVSLHVRRGDYVTNSRANEVHGTCGATYYTRAIEFILEKTSTPHFYIFSDDLEWVKEQNWLKNLKVSFVTGNTELKSYEDMVLMSLCKHNIVANSSFSWWGAWLNQNKGKIVIAPENWLANAEINNLAKQILPSEWIKL